MNSDQNLLASLEAQAEATAATIETVKARLRTRALLGEIAALTNGEFFATREVAPLLSPPQKPRDLARHLAGLETDRPDGFSISRAGRDRAGTLWRVRAWA